MALAKKIRQHDQTVSIVFVTNYADYVYEGVRRECVTLSKEAYL